jgi:predicted Ser/Thr protein kinase
MPFSAEGLVEGTPFGRYRLVELLGRGGMGEVWKAFDTATQRVVAVKVLPPQLAADPVFEQRFRREAFTAASLNEPHVVPIHNFGEIDGRLYVDMRLIEGEDLQHVLKRGPLNADRAVKVIEQVASALNAAHRAGLVHRDVKPSNILLAEDDFAYLIDFGIARVTGETGLTGTGNVIGTWPYMAPERFSTGRTDKSSDTYALACVLYECLTANRPFPGESVEQQIAGHLTTPPPQPSVTQPGVSPQLDAVIAVGMAKDPEQRYHSATELAKAARKALTEPVTKPLLPSDPQITMAGRGASAPTQRFMPDAPTRRDVHERWAPPPPPPGTGPLPPTQAGPVWDGPGPATPTHIRMGDVPPGVLYPPEPAALERAPRLPWWQRRAIVIPIAVVLMVAAVATIFTVLLGNEAKPPPKAAPTLAPTGSLNGTFKADFGSSTRPNGQPYDNAPGGTESWVIESACSTDGCVATASRVSGSQSKASTMVLDNINGTWTSVNATSGTCQNAPTEYWESMTLQQRQDGSLAGQFTVRSTTSCANNQQVTFTRTGDVQSKVPIADPKAQPPRVASPGQGLHGSYKETDTYAADGRSYGSSFDVQTFCLRTGERCLSYWFNPDVSNSFIFQQNKWTLTTTSSKVDCITPDGSKTGATSDQVTSLEFPLPQSPGDPITSLTGHGHNAVTGACPYSSDFDSNVQRTGD